MGGCRQGWNLFSKLGWRVLFHTLKHRKAGYRIQWDNIYTDTFGKYVCALVGHTTTFRTDDFPPMEICCRCVKAV